MGAMMGPMSGLTSGAKANTDAIKDQIAAIDLQIKAQQDMLQAAQDQLAANDLLQQQQDEMHQSYLASLQDQLQTSVDTQNDMRHSGESLVDYQRRMYQDDLQTKIKAEQDKRALVKTNAEIAIEQLKDVTTAQINAYNTEKTALNDKLSAMQSANAAGLASDTAASGGIITNAADVNAAVKKVISSINPGMVGAAQKAAEGVRIAFGHVADVLGTIWTIVAAIVGAIAMAINLAQQLSDSPGFSIVKTLFLLSPIGLPFLMAGAGKAALEGKFGGSQVPGGSAFSNGTLISGFHAAGEIHTQDHLAFVHRNEVTIPLGQSARAQQLADASGLSGMLRGRGGGNSTSFVTHFNGPVADALVASRVMDRMASEARRKGLQFAGVH
jgi:hypothetical protein